MTRILATFALTAIVLGAVSMAGARWSAEAQAEYTQPTAEPGAPPSYVWRVHPIYVEGVGVIHCFSWGSSGNCLDLREQPGQPQTVRVLPGAPRVVVATATRQPQ